MEATYVDHMGTDRTVVNAARVSFNKHKDFFDESDIKLVNYLAKHGHWTPFGHTSITLRMKAPIFIRTQCFKHKIGFIENEVSRRYVDDTPEFYCPESWRGRPTGGAKQGSSDDTIDTMLFHGDVESWEGEVSEFYWSLIDAALKTYESMIKAGIAPEQARMALPQSMYTEWYWTGNLASYARFYTQRTDPHAQKEIRDLADMVGKIIEPLYPYSWSALTV